MDSGFSKHHALLGTGFTFAKATPGDGWTGAEQAPQSSGKAQCSLATPSGHLGSSLLCPKGNTCENSQGWAAGQLGGPLKKIPITSGQMLPMPSWKRVKAGQRKASAQALPSMPLFPWVALTLACPI